MMHLDDAENRPVECTAREGVWAEEGYAMRGNPDFGEHGRSGGTTAR